MSIGSGVLLPGVVEIPTFPILRPLAYTTGLGYRPTCDVINASFFRQFEILAADCQLPVFSDIVTILFDYY